jgi:hypothetical protein
VGANPKQQHHDHAEHRRFDTPGERQSRDCGSRQVERDGYEVSDRNHIDREI